MCTIFRFLALLLISMCLCFTSYAQDPVQDEEYPYESNSHNKDRKNQPIDRTVDNYMGHRYFISSTGRGMKKGEFNYQNIGIGLNILNIGVSKHFSIDVGMIPTFLFEGAPVILGIHPKVSFPLSKDLHLGFGAFYGGAVSREDNELLGLGYGVLTWGSASKNISVGLGYGFKNYKLSPTITAAATYEVAHRTYLIAEVFNLQREFEPNNTLVLLGGRTLLKRVSIDYGAVLFIESSFSETAFIPWLGATFPLKRR